MRSRRWCTSCAFSERSFRTVGSANSKQSCIYRSHMRPEVRLFRLAQCRPSVCRQGKCTHTHTHTIRAQRISKRSCHCREMSFIGLLLIAVGSGGIKPCVAAFGGDQFKLPMQAAQMATFFSIFYFAINSGSLISTFVTPILRNDVQCFGDNDCFSLAFGVPSVLMITSIRKCDLYRTD